MPWAQMTYGHKGKPSIESKYTCLYFFWQTSLAEIWFMNHYERKKKVEKFLHLWLRIWVKLVNSIRQKIGERHLNQILAGLRRRHRRYVYDVYWQLRQRSVKSLWKWNWGKSFKNVILMNPWLGNNYRKCKHSKTNDMREKVKKKFAYVFLCRIHVLYCQRLDIVPLAILSMF